MKRKSLQFKLQEIAKIGTLRTYSRDEALAYYRDGFREDTEAAAEMTIKTRDAYDRGLILCSFKVYEKKEIDIISCSQFAKSLADFVINVVYFVIS